MRNNRTKLLVAVFLLCIGLITVLVLHKNTQSNSGRVTIKGLDTCSKNIHGAVVDNVSTKLYALVKSANDYNKSNTDNSYQASVRDGTCQQPKPSTIRDFKGNERTIETTTLVVDIPDTKQSWKITFDWIKKGASMNGVDLGTIKPECLPVDQLKYGDFKCDSIVSLAKYGTDKADPILQYMPYSGAGFSLDYNPDSKTVSVLILPPPGTKDIAAFTENTKAVIPYWFQKRGLDQSKYTIIYNSELENNADN